MILSEDTLKEMMDYRGGLIAALIVKMGASYEDAEDYVQDAHLKTWEIAEKTGKQPEHIKAYTRQAGINACIMAYRAAESRRRNDKGVSRTDLEEAGLGPALQNFTPEVLEQCLALDAIFKRVAERGERSKTILDLHLEGYISEEISDLLKIAPSSVRSSIRKTLIDLRSTPEIRAHIAPFVKLENP